MSTGCWAWSHCLLAGVLRPTIGLGLPEGRKRVFLVSDSRCPAYGWQADVVWALCSSGLNCSFQSFISPPRFSAHLDQIFTRIMGPPSFPRASTPVPFILLSTKQPAGSDSGSRAPEPGPPAQSLPVHAVAPMTNKILARLRSTRPRGLDPLPPLRTSFPTNPPPPLPIPVTLAPFLPEQETLYPASPRDFALAVPSARNACPYVASPYH